MVQFSTSFIHHFQQAIVIIDDALVIFTTVRKLAIHYDE